MTENEELVRTTIRSGEATLCAVADGALVYQLTGRGIGALVTAVEKERAASHGALDWGDKLVGRAAALLFTLVRPRSVFALTMSTGAQDVLRAADIPFTCDAVIVDVLNRAGTGPCPMEAAVSSIGDPLAALEKLKQVSQSLSNAGRNHAPEKGESMNNLVDRFLHYTSFDTQSDEHSVTFPSTEKQLVLAHELDAELQALGLKDSSVDANGYVTATLPANCDNPGTVPVIAFLAHMDTSPDASGMGVKPRIVTTYDGQDIILNAEKNLVLSPVDFPDMLLHKGEDFIVADGTTLLGADDKAGIAEIMTAIEYLLAHPEVKHGVIKVGFTPDEEVGQGVDRFDVAKFGAKYAYTLDVDELGSLEYENFNAASAEFEITGKSIHPGAAKGIMKNAALIAAELTTLFPSDETPRSTEKREGFFHLTSISGMCEKAEAKYIIRDHDKQRFEQRKSMAHAVCDFLNAKYGEDTVTVHVRDSYYNMREVIEQNMILVDTARGVMEKLGVTPLVKPVRGGTDGSRLSYMGLPCPNLFTGGRNYHGPLEYIVVQSMEKSVQVIVGIAEAFASQPPAAL